MNGLLYKNLLQNRLYFIVAFATFPVIIFLTMCVLGVDNGNGFSVENMCYAFVDDYVILKILLFLIVAVISSFTHLIAVSNDESKKWGYFIATTPDGIESQIYYKYVMVFMLVGISYISACVTDFMIIFFVEKVKGEESPSVINIMNLVFFIQILTNAFDIPFAVRFGKKVGQHVKTSSLLGLFAIFLVCLLFIPFPDNTEEFIDKIFDFVMKALKGGVPDWLYLLTGCFPFIAVASYILSFKISCKLYMKGVESYEG